MLVRKIMETAAALAGRGDLADFLGGKRVADVSAAQRDAETMLRCFNLAENEAASDYLPLVAQQTFPSGGPAAFGDFEKPPLEILWVKDGTGRKLPFSVCGEGVRFPPRERRRRRDGFSERGKFSCGRGGVRVLPDGGHVRTRRAVG